MSEKIMTFGDTRRLILDTIVSLKTGDMDISRGMAIATNMKVLNDNVQVEINAAKLALKAAEVGKDFGEVMRLGQLTVANKVPLIEG